MCYSFSYCIVFGIESYIAARATAVRLIGASPFGRCPVKTKNLRRITLRNICSCHFHSQFTHYSCTALSSSVTSSAVVQLYVQMYMTVYRLGSRLYSTARISYAVTHVFQEWIAAKMRVTPRSACIRSQRMDKMLQVHVGAECKRMRPWAEH